MTIFQRSLLFGYLGWRTKATCWSPLKVMTMILVLMQLNTAFTIQRAPLLPPTLIHSREVWHFTQSERELKSADEATTVYQRMMHPPIFYQFKQSNTKYLEGALYHSWFGLPCIYHPTPGQQLSISVTCLNKENQKYTTANIQVWALESEELQDTACKLGKVIEGKNISKCRRN